MFKGVQEWWQSRKDWHEQWQENWAGYTEPSDDGLSKLQHMVLDVLSEYPPIPLERIQYEGMVGLEGKLPGTERMLCVYNDTVTLTKGRSFNRYDLWDFGGYLTPDEFISSFRRGIQKTISA